MIKLELSIEETNGILHALSQLPYIQVAALIEKIKQQAERSTTGGAAGMRACSITPRAVPAGRAPTCKCA